MRSRHLRLRRVTAAAWISAATFAMTSVPTWAQSASARPASAASETITKPVPALLPRAIQFDIKSTNTGRTYRIYVSRPPVPAPVGGYPVLYVLDADATFATAVSQTFLAAALGHRKPIAVVGISYPDGMDALKLRTRDLTPYVPTGETAKMQPGPPERWGGGDAFHKFMMRELRPIVEGMTPIDKSDQSLMGYSLGGLFATHILLTEPEAYKNYVLGSPTVYFNDKQVLQDLPSFVKKVEAGRVSPRVLITADEWEQSAGKRSLPESFKMVDYARELAETLRAIKGVNGYRVDYALFANETHNSGIPASTSRAVAFVENAADSVER